MRMSINASLVALLALPIASSAVGGELDPPSGAIAPTMKDLVDVEPRTVLRNDFDTITPIVIDSPGSYYLGENIMAIPGQHGIQITASEVTLDLNGFAIYGNTEVGSLDGIHVAGEQHHIVIRNGTVRDFFGYGINGDDANNSRVENVRAFNNGEAGIRIRFNGTVEGCTASNNGGAGVLVSHNSSIRGCTAVENGDDGYACGVGVSISNSTARLNVVEGFDTANGSTLINCASRENGANGFDSAQRSTYMNCASTNNTKSGFRSISAATYLNCSASSNTLDGFEVTDGLIRGCVATFNSGSNYNAGGNTQVLDSHP